MLEFVGRGEKKTPGNPFIYRRHWWIWATLFHSHAMENHAEVLGDTERKFAYSKHTLRSPDIKNAVA